MLKTTRTTLAVAAAAFAISMGAHAAPSDAGTATATATNNASATTTMAALADQQSAGAQGGMHDHRGPRGPHEHHGPGGPGGPGFEHLLEHLHGQLKLDAQHEQAWNQARDTTRKNFMAMRANFQDARKAFKAQASQPILDLSAMQTARDQFASRNQALRADTDKVWIDFYNSLDTTQKTLVSNEIKSHWKHMMHHHWPHDHQAHGDGPPPQDAPVPAAAAAK